MDLPTMLAQVRSPDAAARTAAEQMMEQAANGTPGPFMLALVGELANAAGVAESRQQAGLYLKNMVHAEDEALQETKSERWTTKVDPASKDQVRAGLLSCLLAPEQVIRHTAAQAIGAVAAVDLPNKEWCGPAGLIPSILQAVTNPAVAEGAKEAALEALGFVCEDLQIGDLDPQQTNEVLTAIVDGIKAGRPDATRLSAVNALMNSLAFCEANFGREAERNMLMTVVCEATQCASEPRVREAAYDCVGRIVELFYAHLNQGYIEVLHPMTMHAITSDQESVALMAVEFWTTLCETEMELEGPDNQDYAGKALPHLMPTLLATLEKQNEDADEDDWNLSQSAAVCIQQMAITTEDRVVEHVLPYVSGNVASPEWRKREAALLAFGNILDGPQEEAMAGIIRQALGVLVAALRDPNELVKDTAAWTVSRVAEFCPSAISDPGAPAAILTNVMASLDDTPRVCEKALLVVKHMAEQNKAIVEGTAWFGPAIFGPLLQKLVGVVDRPDWDESNLRVTAYEAVNSIVENSQDDCLGVVLEFSGWVFGKLQASFAARPLSEDDREELHGTQACLVSCLFHILGRITPEQATTIADTTMQNLLQVIAAKSPMACEESFMAAGKLMDKVEGRFDRYLEAFMPLVLAGLQNSAEYQVCSAAVGAMGDLSRAVEAKIMPYCDAVVQALLVALEDPSLKRDVKPPMLSLFGDLAMAIGPQFQRYLAPPSRAMVMLYQASRTTVELENEEMVEYLNELHEAIIEAYTGIVNGLADGDATAVLLQVNVDTGVNVVAAMSGFFQKIPSFAPEDEVVRGAVGLVGDVARNLGKPSAPYLPVDLVQPLLELCSKVTDDEGNLDGRAQEMLAFARAELTKAHAP